MTPTPEAPSALPPQGGAASGPAKPAPRCLGWGGLCRVVALSPPLSRLSPSGLRRAGLAGFAALRMELC
ncbi:hypothetical protein C2U31_20820 [Achromobacter sp. AONIH1]|nr:hypothetical protein C2U31_20820 [Achromobacter sp. AONIH1]